MINKITSQEMDSNALVDSMSRQAIINGNFDIWQRNTNLNLTSANAGFCCDHWRYDEAITGTRPTSIVHSRNQLTSGELPNSMYSYRIAPNGAGSGYGAGDVYYIAQKIENGTRYLCGAGQKVTVSFWAKSSIANKKIGVYALQIYGTGGSANETLTGANFTLSSTFTKYTYTFTTNTLAGKTFGANSDDCLMLIFPVMWGTGAFSANLGCSGVAETFGGSGTIDIAQVQVCSGSFPLPFQPKTFAQELVDCQRYFQKSYNYATLLGTATGSANCSMEYTVGASSPMSYTMTFPVRMRIAPSCGIWDNGGTANKGTAHQVGGGWVNGYNVVIGATSERSIGCYILADTTINGFAFHYYADSEL